MDPGLYPPPAASPAAPYALTLSLTGSTPAEKAAMGRRLIDAHFGLAPSLLPGLAGGAQPNQNFAAPYLMGQQDPGAGVLGYANQIRLPPAPDLSALAALKAYDPTRDLAAIDAAGTNAAQAEGDALRYQVPSSMMTGIQAGAQASGARAAQQAYQTLLGAADPANYAPAPVNPGAYPALQLPALPQHVDPRVSPLAALAAAIGGFAAPAYAGQMNAAPIQAAQDAADQQDQANRQDYALGAQRAMQMHADQINQRDTEYQAAVRNQQDAFNRMQALRSAQGNYAGTMAPLKGQEAEANATWNGITDPDGGLNALLGDQNGLQGDAAQAQAALQNAINRPSLAQQIRQHTLDDILKMNQAHNEGVRQQAEIAGQAATIRAGYQRAGVNGPRDLHTAPVSYGSAPSQSAGARAQGQATASSASLDPSYRKAIGRLEQAQAASRDAQNRYGPDSKRAKMANAQVAKAQATVNGYRQSGSAPSSQPVPTPAATSTSIHTTTPSPGAARSLKPGSPAGKQAAQAGAWSWDTASGRIVPK